MAKLAAAVVLMLAACLLLSVGPATAGSPAAYTNHTVGGDAGWIFDADTNKSAADYSSWVANQRFFLGDFLIFETNVNSTVIQTYNKTTYELCSLDEDYGNLTTQWTPPDGADGGPGNGADAIAVGLTVEGDNYYFSSADDGIQCQNGMSFHIVVAHGSGLPPDLNQPPPPPPTPAAPAPSVPIEATPSSQSETFYRGDGGGGRRAAGRLALAFSGGFLLLPLLLPPPLFPSA